MKKCPLALLAVLIILCFSVRLSADVTVEYLSDVKAVSFRISNETLKEPLIISPAVTSAIFYQADTNNLALIKEPVWSEKIAGGFHGKWRNTKGRFIDVLIKPQGKNYLIKFSAEPACGVTRWGFSLGAKQDEYFTGCFEKVVEGTQYLGTEDANWKEGMTVAMDLHGQTVSMFVSNSMATLLPVLLFIARIRIIYRWNLAGHIRFLQERPECCEDFV